jgi:hypothetical protein
LLRTSTYSLGIECVFILLRYIIVHTFSRQAFYSDLQELDEILLEDSEEPIDFMDNFHDFITELAGYQDWESSELSQ